MTGVARPDHLVFAAATLEEGAHHVEAVLGVPLQAGGRHAQMGTHNRLLDLGPGLYLEVIAIDPEVTPPEHPRWFDLDNLSGPPRLSNWVVRTDDLDEALMVSPPGTGRPVDFARGALTWRMSVPPDGRLPFDGAFPALIEWRGAMAADRLADSGCRLRRLILCHPRATDLRAALARVLDDPRLAVVEGPAAALRAEIDTPAGLRVLE